MLRGLEHERTTVGDLTASVQHLQATLNKVREQSLQVENELNAVRKEVGLKRNERKRQGDKLGEMRKRDQDEVGVMEDTLGFRVNGVDSIFFDFDIGKKVTDERQQVVVTIHLA